MHLLYLQSISFQQVIRAQSFGSAMWIILSNLSYVKANINSQTAPCLSVLKHNAECKCSMFKEWFFYVERERQQFKGLGNPFFLSYVNILLSSLHFLITYFVIMYSGALFGWEPLGNYFSEVK